MRENSTRSDQFTYEEHRVWWARRFSEPTTRIWVAEELGQYFSPGLENITLTRRSESAEAVLYVVGYVRYGCGPPAEPGTAEIAIAVSETVRRSGVAHALLTLTQGQALQVLGVMHLKALVLQGNDASVALFRSCGFRQDGSAERMGKQHSVWVWP